MSFSRLALFALVTSAGCSPGDSRTEVAQLSQLIGSEWRLDSIGTSDASSRNISIEFADSTAGGYSGCNWYGVRYLPAESPTRFTGAESTARACIDPAKMATEVAFHRALTEVATLERTESGLRGRDRAGKVVLTLRERRPMSVDSTALRGTRWVLADDEPGTESPTFEITGDSISGFGGCRGYTGSYNLRGDHLRVTSLAMQDTECRRAVASREREDRFISRLSETAYVTMASDRLTLITFDGDSLLFRRR